MSERFDYVPDVDEAYVQWGNFDKLETIIKSGNFFPVWITGPTGNGKSTMVEQVCAKLGRKFVRVNFTTETSEDDLIGGIRLENGDTVFHDGPVVAALRTGAVLLLDECLEENEEVRVGTVDDWTAVPLNQLELGKTYPVISFNMDTKNLENDEGRIISIKEDDVYEVAFEDGSKILVTDNHPFIVDSDGKPEERTIESNNLVNSMVYVAL